MSSEKLAIEKIDICKVGGPIGPPSWRLIGHDDRARSGEHAAHTMADRDLGAGDLRGGGAAHLAHALLQGVHAVHVVVHVGKTAAIGVERGNLLPGTVVCPAMKAPASPRGTNPKSSRP